MLCQSWAVKHKSSVLTRKLSSYMEVIYCPCPCPGLACPHSWAGAALHLGLGSGQESSLPYPQFWEDKPVEAAAVPNLHKSNETCRHPCTDTFQTQVTKQSGEVNLAHNKPHNTNQTTLDHFCLLFARLIGDVLAWASGWANPDKQDSCSPRAARCGIQITHSLFSPSPWGF